VSSFSPPARPAPSTEGTTPPSQPSPPPQPPARHHTQPPPHLSFAVYMAAQCALLPGGDDDAQWIARHAAAFRAWAEERFTIVPGAGGPSVETLLADVPDRFRTAAAA
jgi:hypothetical protein